MPCRVHAAQVVQTVGCSHQSVDFTLSTLELRQVVEAGHDGCDGLLDQRYQLLGVHVLRLAGWGQGHGRVLLGFLVPGNNFIPQDGLQDAIHLPETGNRDEHILSYLCIKKVQRAAADKTPTWLKALENRKKKVSSFLLNDAVQVSS